MVPQSPRTTNPYSVAALRTHVGMKLDDNRWPTTLGHAIAESLYSGPGFRDYTTTECAALVDAAYPGTGSRCSQCYRKAADVALRANDSIACDDCAAWMKVGPKAPEPTGPACQMRLEPLALEDHLAERVCRFCCECPTHRAHRCPVCLIDTLNSGNCSACHALGFGPADVALAGAFKMLGESR